jgi:vacuolar protein sorting-associated protein 13A/C
VFENLLASVLNKYLTPYVENCDPKQLNIGIWKGNVVLENLRLKPDLLTSLGIPFDVMVRIIWYFVN